MTITTEMLKPLTDAINNNVEVIVPVGLGIMGLFYGIKLIPKIFGWFAH